MFKTFSHFSEHTFKIQQSLYTLANYSENAYIEKLFNKVSIEGRGIFEIVATNRMGRKNVQETSLQESSTNDKKTEKF